MIYQIKLPMQIIANSDYDLAKKPSARDQNRRELEKGAAGGIFQYVQNLKHSEATFSLPSDHAPSFASD